MYSEYIPCCTYLWSSFRSKAANIITKSAIIARYFCALAGLPVLFLGQSRPTVIFGLIERKRPACWSFATQMSCGLEILCRWKCIEYLKNIILNSNIRTVKPRFTDITLLWTVSFVPGYSREAVPTHLWLLRLCCWLWLWLQIHYSAMPNVTSKLFKKGNRQLSIENSSGVVTFKPLSPGLTKNWVKLS